MTENLLLHMLLASFGSALGGIARYGLSGWVARRWGERFPAGTLAVNVAGAFAIGLVAFLPWEEILSAPLVESARAFLMAGILGGFTTVSSFSLQTLVLLQEGEGRKAAGNIVLSVVLCLVAVAAGVICGDLIGFPRA